ncbi:MAG: tetratricopeptide repeat protein, partial [Crocosphaera sp.]
METFTTAKILEFVVNAVITMGVENIPAATKKLWQTIRNRLQNKPVAVTAIREIEENKSQGQIANLMPFLDVEMLSDDTFKQEVHQLAEAAMNQDKDIINQTVIPKPWTNRDEIQGYLEIFYHYYQLGEYDKAFDILRHIDGFMTLQGYYNLQVEYYSDLVRVYEEIGDKSNWKYYASLASLGNAYNSLGQYQQAIQYHQQSLAITTEIGDLAEGEIRKAARNGEATSYNNLGLAYDSLGQYQQAIQYHQQSLAIKTEIGDLAEGEI